MKNLLLIESGILVIAAVTAFLRGNFMLIIEIIGFIGLIFMVTAAIMMRSFPNWDGIGANYSEDRIRANYNPDKEERKQKNRLSEKLFFIGLFNIAISAFAYKLYNRNLPETCISKF